MNLANLLVESARERPDQIALIFEDLSYTYAQIDRLTNRFANALRSLGVEAGSVIAIYLESCPELVISYLGAIKAGVVPNVVNAFLRPEEVRHVVADSEARLLITDPGRHDSLSSERKGMGVERCIVTGWEHDVGEDRAFDTLMPQQSDAFTTLDFPPKTLASLLYTSGTTGNPKGVMLTHLNLIDNCKNFSKTHYKPDDRLLVAAPLFHCWGIINGVMGTFTTGGTAIIIRRFQTEPVLDLIEKLRPTIMIGVPTMYNYMAKSPSFPNRDISSIRSILSAAAPMPLELLDVILKQWKVGYAESYGLTETSPVATTTHFSKMRPGSGGLPMGDTVLKVAGPLGEPLPQGEVGELWIGGTVVSAGYYKKPQATADVFTSNGWFRTGDIVKLDADGYVYVVDRVKDMINVGGEKVYPRDVEEVILRHPAVIDTVVIGIPDPDRGEVVKAYVVRKPDMPCTVADVLDSIRPVLATYKLPREIEFLEAIPRSPSGKALRRLLR